MQICLKALKKTAEGEHEMAPHSLPSIIKVYERLIPKLM